MDYKIIRSIQTKEVQHKDVMKRFLSLRELLIMRISKIKYSIKNLKISRDFKMNP